LYATFIAMYVTV